MRYSNTYRFYLLIALLALFACKSGKRVMPELKETYGLSDKKPFGAYIAYNQVREMYSRNTIRDKRQSFTTTWSQSADDNALYILLARNLYLTTAEVNDMLEYVKKGNDLFIAASSVDENLLNKLGIEQHSQNSLSLDYDRMQSTATFFNARSFFYYYLPLDQYFSGYEDNEWLKPIATNGNGKVNYLVYFHGKGRLFLHSEPRTFSNYFLLQKDNYKYLQHVLAYTKNEPEHVYWDDYYRNLRARKSDNEDGFSSLSEIMKHPALKTAFWLLIVLLLLYLFVGSKRRQRIIDPIKPNINTTVAFTETIGRLYLQKKDNKNMAEKMCTYFNEQVRHQYFLNTNHVNDDFVTALSRKSGVERAKVDSLYRAMEQAQKKQDISDYELLILNELFQQFYKK